MNLPSPSDLEVITGYFLSFLGDLKSSSVTIKGNRYSYLEGGKGDTLIFLHGMGTSKAQARSLLQALINDFHVIAVDVPGLSWETTLPKSRHTLKNLSNWLNDFLNALSIDHCHLVGHSSGAAIAAYYAGTPLSRAETIVLMSLPDLRSDTDGKYSNMWERFVDFKIKSEKDVNDLISQFFYRPVSMPGFISRKYVKNFAKHHAMYQGVLSDLSESSTLLNSRLTLIKCPTLIIRGEHDSFSTEKNLHMLSRSINNAKAVTIHNASHFFFLEKPQKTLELVKKHISQTDFSLSCPVQENAM